MLGGVWESIQIWRNLHSIQMFGDTTSVLLAQQELDNAVDKFAVVAKNNETVGHLLCEYSRILW